MSEGVGMPNGGCGCGEAIVVDPEWHPSPSVEDCQVVQHLGKGTICHTKCMSLSLHPGPLCMEIMETDGTFSSLGMDMA